LSDKVEDEKWKGECKLQLDEDAVWSKKVIIKIAISFEDC
jgi:hypothetical protein